MDTAELDKLISSLGSKDDVNCYNDIQSFQTIHGWKDLTIQELDFEYIPPNTRFWWDDDSNISSVKRNCSVIIPKYRQTTITDYFWPKYGIMGDLNEKDFDFTEVNNIQNKIDSEEDDLMKERMEDLKATEEEKLGEYLEYMEEIETYMLDRCPTCQHSPCWWDQNRGDIQQWCIDHIGHDEVWDNMLAKWCRRQVTREVNRRLHGPEANLLQTLPVCWRIGVFRLYLPYHLKIHFWDPIDWGEP